MNMKAASSAPILGPVAVRSRLRRGRPNKKKSDLISKVGGQRFAKLTFAVTNSIVKAPDPTSLFLERTELFANVISSGTAGAFSALKFDFYPMVGSLQWLRNFANSYSQYEILRLEFTYVPQVPTTTAGSIAMAFYTDHLDSPPTSMAAILTTEQSLFAPCYAGGDGGSYLQRYGNPGGNVISFEVPKHAIAYADGTPKMFKIINEASYAAQSIATHQLYSPGELVIASQGAVGTNFQFGNVFVRYSIRLRGPMGITMQN